MAASSDVSLRRKSGNSSSDRSRRTARACVRRLAASVIRRVESRQWHEHARDRACVLRTEKGHYGGHFLALDVAYLVAHAVEVCRGANRGRSQGIGADTILAFLGDH